jgi:hypothetical protein
LASLTGGAGVPALIVVAGALVVVAGACVTAATPEDFAPAAGTTAPDFTVLGEAFVVGEAFVAGEPFVAAAEGLAAGFAEGGVCALAPAELPAFAGDGDALAFGCAAPVSFCPMDAVTSTVAIAKILISFIVVPFTSSVRSTSQARPLPQPVPASPVLVPPDRLHD